jgi:hypothetical protein
MSLVSAGHYHGVFCRIVSLRPASSWKLNKHLSFCDTANVLQQLTALLPLVVIIVDITIYLVLKLY